MPGKDEDFGVDSTFMTYNGIKEAPFYAIKRMPGLLCTAGGLTINEKLEVLNEAGEPLGGLYAAATRRAPTTATTTRCSSPGGSHGRAWTFGVLAARSALGLLDEPVDTWATNRSAERCAPPAPSLMAARPLWNPPLPRAPFSGPALHRRAWGRFLCMLVTHYGALRTVLAICPRCPRKYHDCYAAWAPILASTILRRRPWPKDWTR